MENLEDKLFLQPTRQSPVAIILMLIDIYKKFIKTFWYILLPLVLGKRQSTEIYLYGLGIIAIILTIYSLIDYFRYYFHVKEHELIVERGVFSKKTTIIKFDRIQSINFKQNLIQQLFKVVGLEIDTAGTSKKEFDFDALSTSLATELRDYIFEHKSKESLTSSNDFDTINLEDRRGQDWNGQDERVITKEVMSLSTIELLKIGLTQNHFRSLFFAFISIFWLMDQLRQFGIDLEEYENLSEEQMGQLGLYMIGGIFIFAIIAIIIISVIRIFFKYYNFLLLRIKNGFKLEYGLFNRNEISVMDNKMQVLIWSDNLLRKALGMFSLQIKLASSMVVRARKSIIIPGLMVQNINLIKDYYFENDSWKLSNYKSIDSYYLYRRITIVILVFSIPLAILLYLSEPIYSIVPAVFMVYFGLTSWLKYNKAKYGNNEEVIEIKNGIFGNKNVLLFIRKLQGVELQQSYIQRRRGLTNIVLFTAAGNEKIRYISRGEAEQLRDYILFKIETDEKEWM